VDRVEFYSATHSAELLHSRRQMYDVVIVGGGPAGLSAALMLGRCRRKVLVCDEGNPRNRRSRALHGFLTRDGTPPLELLALGRDELAPYDVELRAATVTDISRLRHGFAVRLTGERVESRTVLIATGVRDQLPDIPGIEQCFGVSVHHCPFCDGWECRDRRIAVIGTGVSPAGLALSLRTWTHAITVCANGMAIRAAHREQLRNHGIATAAGRIAGLEHESGWARRLVFENGSALECDAVFLTGPQRQQCELASSLGCEFNRRGTVRTDLMGKTCVPGVYVVGDASRDVQFAVVAAAEGAKAAVAINQELQAMSGLALRRSA
jgi:thioredoxin reductase